MTAANDLTTVATAAAGAAEVRDQRTIAGRRQLIGAMVRAMKAQHAHPGVDEAVQAVNRFYDTDPSGDQIDGEAFVATLRRLRLQVVRDAEVVEAGAMTARQAAQWQEEKDIIRSWTCPECEAKPTQRCINRATGKPMGEYTPGHLGRIKLAEAAARQQTA